MLLRGQDANRYLAKPDPTRAGLLIFGADAMRVALKRQGAILSLIGPEGEAEMRLARLSGADLRKDQAALLDALKATGFFPGPRVTYVEEATDGLAPMIEQALSAWRPGDATLVVTAGDLKGKSALKTLFEKRGDSVVVGLYDDPPTREEIEAELKRAGLSSVSGEAMADLTTLARALDPGDFRQTLEKISLFKWQDQSPLTPAEVAALAPATIESEIDDLLSATAERDVARVGALFARLASGTSAVTLCIQALRYFRTLHGAACDPAGPAIGLQKGRVFGPRRDRMQSQLRKWSSAGLEQAVADLLEADLTLRSSSRAPAQAVIERSLLRIAAMRG